MPRARPKTRLIDRLEAKKTADMPRARPKARHKNIPDQATPLQEANSRISDRIKAQEDHQPQQTSPAGSKTNYEAIATTMAKPPAAGGAPPQRRTQRTRRVSPDR